MLQVNSMGMDCIQEDSGGFLDDECIINYVVDLIVAQIYHPQFGG